jgi:putative transposase
LATHQKKARDDGAHIVLIDESGFFINPLVRRTWALRGQTPVLTGFGRHRDKVSTIAAITVAPNRRRIGLYFQTDPKTYVDATAVVKFLRSLLKRLRGKVIVIWDGGSNHKGPLIRELLERFPRLHLERLPAYAPDLNPVELIWSHLKYGLMANFVPRHVEHLDQVVQENLAKLSRKPSLIKSLWAGSRLPFPQAKLATRRSIKQSRIWGNLPTKRHREDKSKERTYGEVN